MLIMWYKWVGSRELYTLAKFVMQVKQLPFFKISWSKILLIGDKVVQILYVQCLE